MSATTTTLTVHGWPTRALSDLAVICRRNLLQTVRLPEVLVLSASMPAIFILMFTYVFGGAIQGALPPAATGRYVNWLLPGLLAQFALFGGAGTASGLAEDLAKGVIDRFRSLPVTSSAVLAATYLVVFPLAFTSSVFVPTQTMPTWLQPFAAHQPVTVAAGALRGLVLGPGALPPGRTVGGQVALALLWAAAITALFAPLAVHVYRRTLG
jgi:hypothetical protein